MRRYAILALLTASAAGLAGCSADKAPEQRAEQDPAVSAALNEQLMTDPDLARINSDNRALAGGGPARAAIPLEDRSPEALARARADAAALLGRAPVPAPPASAPALPAHPRDTLALAAAAALGPASSECIGKLEYGFIWAARMPGALPVYPRGHAQDAAGTDRDGCALRAVAFVTPVPAEEVAAFYWSALSRAEVAAEHRMAGADHLVIGRRGAGQGTAFIRARDDGLTEVDLVSRGL